MEPRDLVSFQRRHSFVNWAQQLIFFFLVGTTAPTYLNCWSVPRSISVKILTPSHVFKTRGWLRLRRSKPKTWPRNFIASDTWNAVPSRKPVWRTSSMKLLGLCWILRIWAKARARAEAARRANAPSFKIPLPIHQEYFVKHIPVSVCVYV